MRAALAASLLALGLGLVAGGCADDCDQACGKLDFCEQLLTMDVFGCVDACEKNDDDAVSPCAECLDAASCNGVAGGGCAQACQSFER